MAIFPFPNGMGIQMTTQSAEHPAFLTRMRALIAGEVSADTLESYRNAGGAAYKLFIDAEQRRNELADAGKTPWTMTAAERINMVSTWVAFALQTLGDAFLEATYEADPGTVGFVPAITARQADLFYGEVANWLAFAAKAETDDQFLLPVHMPFDLPAFVEVDPCPTSHLLAMLAAASKIVDHAGIAVADCARSAKGGDHDREIATLKGRMAAITASHDYAQSMHRDGVVPSNETHERIEATIKTVIVDAFRIGQIAAMPELAAHASSPVAASSPIGQLAALARPMLPLPGQPGFDRFCLTDPHCVSHLTRDPKAGPAIDYLWSHDPSPQKTLAIQEEILAALVRGDIDYGKGSTGRIGHYYCCPWSAIYHVNRPVVIGGQELQSGQEFTYDVSADISADVSAEEIADGGLFKRNILVSRFSSTSRTDYCDGGKNNDGCGGKD
ncbi:MAG: hypothetical protein M0002_17135 [Rhodospirillales bacterium]|nr:hypothetical protein [Rhodospirillales bacterium]